MDLGFRRTSTTGVVSGSKPPRYWQSLAVANVLLPSAENDVPQKVCTFPSNPSDRFRTDRREWFVTRSLCLGSLRCSQFGWFMPRTRGHLALSINRPDEFPPNKSNVEVQSKRTIPCNHQKYPVNCKNIILCGCIVQFKQMLTKNGFAG